MARCFFTKYRLLFKKDKDQNIKLCYHSAIMAKPYEGKDNYIFVSYAHADSEVVLPIIYKLQDNFNVWYDAGITSGREWDEEISEHLEKASLFVFMVSNKSLESENCLDEIAFAKDNKIPFINVLIEPIDSLPNNFKLRFGRYQMCIMDRYHSLDEFIKDIYKSIKKMKVHVPLSRSEEFYPDEDEENVIDYDNIDLKDFNIVNGVLKEFKNYDLEEVIIPNGVVEIEPFAFSHKKKITSIFIPNTVTRIGCFAFLGCESLKKVVLSNSITTIEKSTFEECVSLMDITIPKRVTNIEECAFEHCCSLLSINIPAGMAHIGENAFKDCFRLVEVINKSTLPIRSKSREFGDIGYRANIINNEKDSLLRIDDKGFVIYNNTDLVGYFGNETHVVVPDGIKFVCSYAFYNRKNISSIFIHKNVILIGISFSGCTSLQSIEVDKDNECYSSIDGVLYNKRIDYLISCPSTLKGGFVIPNTIKSIAMHAFKDSSLSSIILPHELHAIFHNAFENCLYLKNIFIPKSVETIEEYAFKDSKQLLILCEASKRQEDWSKNWNKLNEYSRKKIKTKFRRKPTIKTDKNPT